MKTFTLAFLLSVILTFISCEMKELDHGLNPYDPENPSYQAPQVMLTNAPDNGSTVFDDSITIAWQGNQNNLQYSYRYKEKRVERWFSWSSWSTLKSTTLGPLDELSYDFELRCKYPGDEGAEGNSLTRSFTIDAVEGPSAILYPKKIKESKDQIFTVQIIAEEVNDLLVADLTISYPVAKLSLQSQPTKGDLVNESNIILLTRPDNATQANGNGNLTISIGMVNLESGVSGSGALCELKFKALQSVSSGRIRITTASYRDYENNNIDLNRLGATVFITN